jgi:serine/threonine protein kinase
MSELESGRTLAGRFILERSLGKGGMAEVWLVRDRELDEELVAKILPPGTDDDRVALLRRECRQARRLVHPNIVRVFDFHRGDGYSFVTMEHVEGATLDPLRGRPPSEIVAAALPIADALEYAHGLGIVHRDLKTGNVVCDASGRPRLLDFGIAGLLDPVADPIRLRGGGTPRRASPQQLAGEDPSPADDIYGLGALIHELITGSPPSADRSGSAVNDIESRHPVPERLRGLVGRMLAELPGDRPLDMAAVKAELTSVRDELRGAPATDPPASEIRLTPPPRVERVRPTARVERGAEAEEPSGARWVPWATGAAVVVLSLAVVAVFVWLPRWAERVGVEPIPTAPAGGEIGGAPVPEPEPPQPEIVAPVETTEVESRDAPPPPPERNPEPVRSEPPPSIVQSERNEPPVKRIDPAFADAMSEALEALERGDWPAAREALHRAGAIRPGAPAVADGLARVDQAEKLAAIAAHRAAASLSESEERWADAAREYTAVLALDPTIRFAQNGKERCVLRADLDRRLDYHLSHPERLSSDEVLEEAKLLVDRAAAVEPEGARLQDQVARLTALIERVAIPVRVVIQSDDLTEVMVYKVGRLGAFLTHELELRPGSYTVVGSRQGYRDVRRELVVVAGENPEPLVVRCEEKI